MDVSALVHPELQGGDFRPLKPGAPLLLEVDTCSCCSSVKSLTKSLELILQ